MRPSSSPSIPLSSASKLPSVSFLDRYERIFQCEGGACIIEDKDVSMYQYHQSRSDEADEQQNNSNHQITTTEALQLNVSSSSYQGASRKHQESPLLVVRTVRHKHQASYKYNDEDTFDIDERRIQSRTKTAQTEEAANNEYFNNRIQQLQVLIHNSNDQSQTQITQMALPIISSPDPTTQQQQQRHQQQQHCQCHSPTPSINSNKTDTRTPKLKPKKSTPIQYEMCTVVMPSNFRLLKERPQHNGRSWKHTDDSESTQSTLSMSESEDDDLSYLESHHFGRPEEEDSPVVSILRRRIVVQFGTNADTTTNTKDRNRGRGRGRVRFERGTVFPDPNERPSPARKHVPRMSQRQKQEYQLNNYQPTDQRRQVDISSLLIQLFLQHRPL